MGQLNIITISIRIDYHLNGQLPSSLLILKCTMSHGTMKYITHS